MIFWLVRLSSKRLARIFLLRLLVLGFPGSRPVLRESRQHELAALRPRRMHFFQFCFMKLMVAAQQNQHRLWVVAWPTPSSFSGHVDESLDLLFRA